MLANWRKRGNRIPVVVLTARGSWQEKVEGFKAGADDYVGKPFQFEELLARIGAVAKRGQGAAAGPLTVAGVTLDEQNQSLIAGRRQPQPAHRHRVPPAALLHAEPRPRAVEIAPDRARL